MDDFRLPYEIAIRLVQVTRHISRAAAQKALDDAIAAGKLRTQSSPQDWVWANGKRIWPEGPSIAKSDLDRWLNAPPKALGKQPLAIELLRKRFDGKPVPDPALCPRKALLAELRCSHKSLASLDDDTLKKSIERYNASTRNDPNRINSD